MHQKNRLLRVGEFGHLTHGPNQRVRLVAAAARRSDDISNNLWLAGTGLVSVGFLRRWSLHHGALVWIEYRERRVVVRLAVVENNDDDGEGSTTADAAVDDKYDEPDEELVALTPTAALNLHLVGSGIGTNGAVVDGWMKLCPATHQVAAESVTLQCWARPMNVPPLLIPEHDDNDDDDEESSHFQKDDAWIRKALPASGTVVQTGTLVVVQPPSGGENDNHKKNATLAYFEVISVTGNDSSTVSFSPRDIGNQVFVVHDNTDFRVETSDPETLWNCPRLVDLSSSPGAPQLRPCSSRSHPDFSRLRDEMSCLSGRASPSERLLVVVGTEDDHHLGSVVATAAQAAGRPHVLDVRGLAAHALRSKCNLRHRGGLGDKLAGLQAALRQAQACAPSVLLLRDWDAELDRHDPQLRGDQERRLLSLLTQWPAAGTASASRLGDNGRGLLRAPAVVVVFSMAQDPRPGPLLEHLAWEPVRLSLPSPAYAEYLWSQRVDSEGMTPVHNLGQLLEGRTCCQITSLAEQVATRNQFGQGFAGEEDLENFVSDRIKAMEKQSWQKSASARIPTVLWEDVGGLDQVRAEIMEAIELPTKFPHLFPPGSGRSGILLYGPPGSGKTLVAKAVATECGLPFLSIKGPELLGSYVGESESNVRSVFHQARTVAALSQSRAAILFFDEMDSLAPRRGEQGSGGSVMDRVVATLLTELDKSGKVTTFCIGATNRPDMLDPALLRPGRLDRQVYLGPSDMDKRRILEVHLSKRKLEGTKEDLAASVLQTLPENVTGADLFSIVNQAHLLATNRLCDEVDVELSFRQSDGESDLTMDELLSEKDAQDLEAKLTVADLTEAIAGFVPSIDADQLKRYEQMRHDFETRK